MPNVTIEIQSPRVNPSPTYPYFKVRYREKGTPLWTDDPNNRTNAPYVWSFPSPEVVWEMEVSVVNSAIETCDPIIYDIPIRQGCNCLADVSHSVATTHGLNYLTISYTLPETQPPCGWIIVVKNPTKADRYLTYASLPAGSTSILLTSGDNAVEIYANCCNEVMPGAFTPGTITP